MRKYILHFTNSPIFPGQLDELMSGDRGIVFKLELVVGNEVSVLEECTTGGGFRELYVCFKDFFIRLVPWKEESTIPGPDTPCFFTSFTERYYHWASVIQIDGVDTEKIFNSSIFDERDTMDVAKLKITLSRDE